MRRLLLLCLALFVLLPPVVAAEEEAAEYNWSIGWVSGIELQRRLGDDWNVFLGAGPNDSRSEETTWEYWDEIGAPPSSNSPEPADRRTESGWVALGAGRSILEDGPFQLQAFARGRYFWSHGSNESIWYRTSGAFMKSHENGDLETYSLALGLRPVFRLHERVTVESRLDLTYAWGWSRNVRQEWDHDESGTVTRYNRRTMERTQTSFADYGTSSLLYLGFKVWF